MMKLYSGDLSPYSARVRMQIYAKGITDIVRGADLLALAEDRSPDAAGLSSLRRMMRQVIAFHLGGGELRAWRVLR